MWRSGDTWLRANALCQVGTRVEELGEKRTTTVCRRQFRKGEKEGKGWKQKMRQLL